MKKVILVDGNNLLFRSYYATAYSGNTMKNSKGFSTNALYGYINMMNKIIKEEKPEYIMVAFDKGKTFRHEKYTAYKDGRSETPNELKEQFPVAKKLTEAMGIKYFEIDNYEADDIIGTFSKKISETDGVVATIISSDKDLLQLINDDIEVKLLKQNDYIRMTHEEFINTYGIEPPRMVDLKALMGDSSDNIPGVKGIGEKTALNLLHEWINLDNLYNNIDKVKGKAKEKLIADKDNAYMSYDIATIYKEVPIDTSLENIKYDGIDIMAYMSMLEKLEFYSILRKLDFSKEAVLKEEEEKIDFKILTNLENIKFSKDYSIYLEVLGDNYHRSKPLGVAVYNDEMSYYIPFAVLLQNKNIFNDTNKKFTYDLKKMLVVFKYNDISLANCSYDLMIAGYLLNYNIKDDISYLANNFGISIDFYESVFGKGAKLHEVDLETVASNAIKKAKFIYDTKDDIYEQIEKEDATYLFNEIEMPLAFVLADMETTGIIVDKSFLDDMELELGEKLKELEGKIFELAGCRFNISSPKQLAMILFEELKIPYPKKVKDYNYSTSKDILDKLVGRYPIVELVLNYRTLSKLQSNYVVGLKEEIFDDGRVHTIFNQTLTRTGRLSSMSPNLQNIPIRLEEGKLIRKAFKPDPNSFILSSDYSQIELRIFASLSKALNMIEAFTLDKDIHAKTAADIFKVSESMVTKDMRRTAKAVNFGILYGISSFGLSEDLGIDIVSAKGFIDGYLKTYPGIKEYMDKVIEQAHKDGYVKTIMNRKRTIDELHNKNYMIRSQGERMALNTPVQGSSADILKKAMIEIYDEFNKRGLKSKMIIQVHDELVFNVFSSEEDEVKEIVKDIMENTYKLDVPLKVDIEFGKDWYQAK